VNCYSFAFGFLVLFFPILFDSFLPRQNPSWVFKAGFVVQLPLSISPHFRLKFVDHGSIAL
jgi:hypothetical protein